MKIKLSIIFVLFFKIAISQNSFYVDSIQNSLNILPEKQQLKAILKIPYDKFIGNISTSEKLENKAVKLAIKLNDSNSLAEAYLKLGLIYGYKDKREKKLIFRLKAIKIFEEIDSLNKAGYAYGELGFSMKHEDLNRALFYMRKGLKLVQNSNSSTYDNYGILQGMLYKYDSALYYHNKSLLIKKNSNDSIGIPFGYVHLATVNINLGKYQVAKKYIDSSQTIRKKRKDTYGIADNYLYYGDLYFAQKNYQKSLAYFKKGYALSKQNHFTILQKYCAKYITKSYVAINDYKNAFNYNKIYQSLQDSTVNAQTNSKVEQLKIEFETAKKEKEISLQKEQLLKNELQIKTKNIYTLLLASSILLLGIIIFGLYKRQKHKHREYQNLLQLKESQTYSKLQDQRLRISRDLHDNIGAQLTFIISSIDNLKFLTKNPSKNLKLKLTEINNFASNTITQLRDTIWAMNRNEISLEDLQSRILSFIDKAKTANNNLTFTFKTEIKSAITFSSIKGINIFRVIQEAINNALKYAHASTINIIIKESENHLYIEIKDNGKGFNLNTVKLGNGLENMQKRMEEIDSEITIYSEENKGTSIKISCLKNRTNDV